MEGSSMKTIEIEGQKIEIASTVDAVGLFCPVPIVKLKLEIDKLDSKQVVEVLADDPGFERDVIAWCRETENRLLSLTKNQEEVFAGYIEKA
jgi:TusA-related sulfurtransferase